jgi:hypothetical protein
LHCNLPVVALQHIHAVAPQQVHHCCWRNYIPTLPRHCTTMMIALA